MKVITLEVGNTSWWKNRKYRREAANELKELRLKYKKVKLLKKYRVQEANTILKGLKEEYLKLVASFTSVGMSNLIFTI